MSGCDNLPIDHEYPLTPRQEWDWKLQSEGNDFMDQVVFLPVDFQQMWEIHGDLSRPFDPEVGAEPYPEGEVGFKWTLDDAVPDVPYLV